MRKSLFILAILIFPLIQTFFSGCGPAAQEKARQKAERDALAKYPELAEWKNMRTRLTPEGTEVRWTLYVHYVDDFSIEGDLWGQWGYAVTCWTRIAPSSVDTVAKGDWVRVVGRFLKVDERGRVKITVEQLTNLGPSQ